MKNQNKFFSGSETTEYKGGSSTDSVFLKHLRQSDGAYLKAGHPNRASNITQHSDIFTAVAAKQPFTKDFRSEDAYQDMKTQVFGLKDTGPQQSL
ncbi:MAG: hypothetical protein ACX932_02655 [Gammaproteobacteria bacterium]